MLKCIALTAIILSNLFHPTNFFNFFHADDTIKTYYKYQEEIITEVTFNIPDIVTNTSEIFTKVWEKLREPFNITFEQTMDATDSIYIQAGDFFMLTSKVNDLQTKHKELVKTLKALPTHINTEKNITVELDKSSLQQKIRNIQITGAQLELLMKTKTIDTLKADVEKFSKFLSIYEDLNTDAETVVETLNDFYTVIQLTYHKVKTNYIQQYLLPEEQNDAIDLDYNILGTYLNDNHDVICIINQNILKKPIKYLKFYPIPYNNMSLEHNYVLNQNTSKIEQLFTPTQINLGTANTNEQCLNTLNENFPHTINVTNVIEKCQFIPNYKQFQKTAKGILVYRVSQTDLNAINKQFKNDTNITLTTDNLPVYIQFNGTLTIHSNYYNNISFNDTQALKYTFTNLTKTQQHDISLKNRKTHKIQYDFSNIDELLIDNYPIFIVATAISFAFFLIIITVRSLSFKCQRHKPKEFDRFLRNRAEKNRQKNRKKYKVSHF